MDHWEFHKLFDPYKCGYHPSYPFIFGHLWILDGCYNPYIHWDDPASSGLQLPSGAVSSEGPTCQLATLAATEALDVTRRCGTLRRVVSNDHWLFLVSLKGGM